MGVPRADVDCLCVLSPSPALLNRCGNFPVPFNRVKIAIFTPFKFPALGSEVTFDNIAVNRCSEILSGVLVEVLAVDDPHLFEESRLAALASAEEKDLHQPFYIRFLLGETSVDLFGLSQLFHLAAVKQADG